MASGINTSLTTGEVGFSNVCDWSSIAVLIDLLIFLFFQGAMLIVQKNFAPAAHC